uniref:Adenylate kinase isoenzyme 1 n=1 Tax=Caligus clemensi TaxID=344056 RepID=C1C0K9_CALCM|nr:Adenylate kinase isoenzyme 1 [Caligus clemensi]
MSADKSILDRIPIVWVVGGPGSGKGTHCESILAKYGFTHLSTGDLLRIEVMSGSDRGLKLYKIMSNGDKAPNDMVDEILVEAMIAKASESKGFLIDGYPINIAQAECFIKDIREPNCLLVLEANNEVLRGRLKARGNFDDTDESIKKRIATFNDETRPILSKFSKITKIVNAERKPEQVWEDVNKIILELIQ